MLRHHDCPPEVFQTAASAMEYRLAGHEGAIA